MDLKRIMQTVVSREIRFHWFIDVWLQVKYLEGDHVSTLNKKKKNYEHKMCAPSRPLNPQKRVVSKEKPLHNVQKLQITFIIFLFVVCLF